MKFSITNPDQLTLPDENGRLVMGSNQKWFPTLWQRMAGCGPTVASNLLMYHERAGRIELPYNIENKETALPLMEYSWIHITPGMRGVNKTSMFYEGLKRMILDRESELKHHALNIGKEISDRPSLETLVSFLRSGFEADSPVAFLNLHSGDVPDLDDWHWMTAFSLDYDRTEDKWLLSLTDNGVIQSIDLGLWLKTSKLGGGFVYLTV